MLIEELIRLGRPLAEGGLEADELLRLVTDVGDERARNFYRHVFVVELPRGGVEAQPAVLPMQVWGVDLDGDFRVDAARATGAPIILPSGGNPLYPQGRYGVPVYPCWDAHFQEFRQSADDVLAFLRPRVSRTLGAPPPEGVLQAAAERLHRAVADTPAGPRDKWLGVIVLAQPGGEGVYRYASRRGFSALGESSHSPGQFLVADRGRLLERLWAARFEEGAEKGRRAGSCSFSGEGPEVVAPYSTTWPWAFLTWTCPLPRAGMAELLVEGIGLSESSYRALVTGASVFRRLTRLVQPIVLHELFAPGADREGRNLATRRKLNDLPRVYGSTFLLPVQDHGLTDPGPATSSSKGYGPCSSRRGRTAAWPTVTWIPCWGSRRSCRRRWTGTIAG
jgi:hypothetical protein